MRVTDHRRLKTANLNAIGSEGGARPYLTAKQRAETPQKVTREIQWSLKKGEKTHQKDVVEGAEKPANGKARAVVKAKHRKIRNTPRRRHKL